MNFAPQISKKIATQLFSPAHLLFVMSEAEEERRHMRNDVTQVHYSIRVRYLQ